MSATAVAIDTEEQVLTIERILHAAPDRVFDAFINPAKLLSWFGPEGVICTANILEIEEGGAYSLTLKSATMGDNTVTGVFREITPHSRIVITWGWIQEDGHRGEETIATFDFAPHADGTLMSLRQGVFSKTEFRDRHMMGWSGSFDKLSALFN